MAPLGYVEVLDAKGNVTERVRVDSFPIQVGRAYSNHVVINDPYVCPVHLAIERDEHERRPRSSFGAPFGYTISHWSHAAAFLQRRPSAGAHAHRTGAKRVVGGVSLRSVHRRADHFIAALPRFISQQN